MPNSDTSQFDIGYVAESSWGSTPASALQLLRVTGESLGQSLESTISNTLRSDRNVDDVIRTAIQGQGDVNFEMSYGSFDDFLEAGLGGDFSADLAISATTISADGTGETLDGSLTTEFANVEVGQWIKVAGFTETANNGFFRVTAKASDAQITLDANLTTEAAGDTVVITGGMLRNGTTKKSFTLEKQFTDVSEYISLVGMRVATLALNIATGQIVTGTLGFQGKNAAINASSVGTGAATAATTTGVMNAIDHVKNIEWNNDAAAFDIQNIALNITNNLRNQNAVGNLGSIGIGYGTCEVSGSMQAYFADSTLYDEFIAFSERAVSFRLEDTAGNAYIVTLPKIKITANDVAAGGQNQDVFANLQIAAKLDSTTSCAIQIDRFAA